MGISVEELFKDRKADLDLELVAGEAGLKKELDVADVNRCGLALAGYFDYFASERIQVIGNAEVEYLKKLGLKKKEEVLEKIFSHRIPMLVICRSLPVAKEIIRIGNLHKVPVLKTPVFTTKFISEITNYLEEKLAPKTRIHGVMVDVYGVGVLITGKSGVGKSECALDLVKRGHRLVADDLVEVIKTSDKRLFGFPQKLLRFYLEVRGLGIVNIKELFGVGATRDRKRIELIVQMEEWDEKKHYERVGQQEQHHEILEVKIPKITIPVKPGRNIAIIVEVAAMQGRLKKMGYSSVDELEKNVLLEMEKGKNKN
ncbi:MAG: HPr(Ser) kinase/phosphatase [Candidatus Firestonebacteria bacterium]